MREVLDKLDECEGRLSKLLTGSATDESEANYPMKTTPQEGKEEVVFPSRNRKGMMRSKMVIDKINDMKMKLGSTVTLRKAGKTKVDSEISIKAVNSAKRKCVEEAMDRLPGTDRMLTDIAVVPPVRMAGLKSATYKTKRSDRTLTGATLEMEILSQCGERTLQNFKPSSMNHGGGRVIGQLVPVEHNRLTMSKTVSIDEPAGGYMEMMEYRNLARGHLIALENKSAMEGYFETMTQGTTLKQKAYETLVSSETPAKTVGEPTMESSSVTVLRKRNENHSKDTSSDSDTLCENRITTEVRLVHDWTDTRGIRFGRKRRSKGEKVFIMTKFRDLIIQEGAAVPVKETLSVSFDSCWNKYQCQN